MVEGDALSRIGWEKCDETIQSDSIQAIVTTAITEHKTSHIDAIPCSPQTIDLPIVHGTLLPSIPEDTPIASKAITQSSRQSDLMHLGTELFISEMESKIIIP